MVGGGLSREMAEPRDRPSRLSEATLRINESLDFDTALQVVMWAPERWREFAPGWLQSSGRRVGRRTAPCQGSTGTSARVGGSCPAEAVFFEYLMPLPAAFGPSARSGRGQGAQATEMLPGLHTPASAQLITPQRVT